VTRHNHEALARTLELEWHVRAVLLLLLLLHHALTGGWIEREFATHW
jgi:hypothetical protein